MPSHAAIHAGVAGRGGVAGCGGIVGCGGTVIWSVLCLATTGVAVVTCLIMALVS